MNREKLPTNLSVMIVFVLLLVGIRVIIYLVDNPHFLLALGMIETVELPAFILFFTASVWLFVTSLMALIFIVMLIIFGCAIKSVLEKIIYRE